MSSYLRRTKHPETGLWETAAWLDDHFGQHHYGVKFLDGKMFDPRDTVLNTTDGSVDGDWEKFFPSASVETLPSHESLEVDKGSAVQPRPEMELRQNISGILFNNCDEMDTKQYGMVYVATGDAIDTMIDDVQSLIAQEADKLANKRVREVLERLDRNIFIEKPMHISHRDWTQQVIDAELDKGDSHGTT